MKYAYDSTPWYTKTPKSYNGNYEISFNENIL